MFIINTDQGYIAGEIHLGLQFTTLENARTFKDSEFEVYGGSFIKDLHTYYLCETVEIEYIK